MCSILTTPTCRWERWRGPAAARTPALTACGETQAAFGRRSIPAEPRRFAPLIVAFRSKYTRYSSLTRLVSRAPHRPRRSPWFHHRLLPRTSCSSRPRGMRPIPRGISTGWRSGNRSTSASSNDIGWRQSNEREASWRNFRPPRSAASTSTPRDARPLRIRRRMDSRRSLATGAPCAAPGPPCRSPAASKCGGVRRRRARRRTGLSTAGRVPVSR